MMVMENEFERQIEQLFAAEELAELWDEIMDAYSNDQIDKARTLLNQLLEENPDFSRAYLMLGNIALKEEDSEEAIMQFQRALDAASRIL
ncbi:MAG TPA: tetratricopeptide repeat protein, partial [Armatimonadetes bacterium]|nr:tetratricopeptide repeat protein [Armatimonadota bacterium]